MNYLSFSLWGDNPMYNVGTIRNAELWKEIYPDWQMVVYFDNSVPNETIIKLTELGVITIDMSSDDLYGMFWRFLALDIIDCEYAVFRDCDSRISIREKMAVDEWIDSGKTLHVMRDHPAHGIPYGANGLSILGGMWGIKRNNLCFTEMIVNFCIDKPDCYGIDQNFLQFIYSTFENDKITHDEFFEHKPFPIKRESGVFIGGRIDINDKPVGQDYLAVI
jgi:hypothetical protein